MTGSSTRQPRPESRERERAPRYRDRETETSNTRRLSLRLQTSRLSNLLRPLRPPPSGSIVSTPRTAPVRRWVRHSRNPSWTSTRSLAKMLGKLALQSATRHPRWRGVRCPRRRRRAQLGSPPRRGDQIGVRDRDRIVKRQRELINCSALPARRLAWAVSEMQGWRLSESPLLCVQAILSSPLRARSVPYKNRARWAGDPPLYWAKLRLY